MKIYNDKMQTNIVQPPMIFITNTTIDRML
jgi:hypothetical protein